MSISQIAITNADQNTIVAYINNYRAKHQSPPLTWDVSPANFAQNWSYYLLSNNLFQHSNSKLYGENLSYFQGYKATPLELILKSVDVWYNEISMYDFNNSGYQNGTGHFTCLIWKSSTKFGIGISINKTSNEVVISMNTSPPGNILGQFAVNVLPIASVPGPAPLPEPMPEPTPTPVPTPTPTPVPTPTPIPVPTPTPTPVPTPTPIPLPEPTPLPEPEPQPEPEPTPLNPYINIKTAIASAIYEVIYNMQQNFPKFTILMRLQNIIDNISSIPDTYFDNKAATIETLRNIQRAMRRNYSKYVVVRLLDSIATQIKQSIAS